MKIVAIATAASLLLLAAGCEPKSDRVYVSAAEIYQAGESKPSPIAEKDVLDVPIYPGAFTPKGVARVVRVNDGMSSALMTVGDAPDKVANFYAKKLSATKVSRNPSGTMVEGMGPGGKFVYINLNRKEEMTQISISIFDDAPTASEAPKVGDTVETTDKSGISGPIGNG